MSTTTGPAGTGGNPQTVSRMREASAVGGGGGDGPRQWENGGRIKALIRSIPIATFTIMLACTGVFMWELTYDESIGENVICTPLILGPWHQWWRIFSNAWLHVTLFHIGFNMLALYQVGSAVEEAMGTLAVFGHTVVFPWLVGLVYLAIQTIASRVTGQTVMGGCAVGYSGVLFAFLIVEVCLAHLRGETHRSLMGRCQIPILFYPAVLLLLISLVMQNVSFLGHVSGILVGVLYVRGLLQPLTLPRQWCLALERCLPHWLTSRPGWRPYPAEDPFKGWEPPCFRSVGFCPDAPNIDGGCGAIIDVLAQLFRSRQVSGYAVGSGPAQPAAGGRRPVSRLVAPVPLVPVGSPSAPPSALGVEGYGGGGPPSPSRVRSDSVPARPPSQPIDSPTAMAEGSSADGGHYARLQGDDVDSIGDDVEAQLLNMRNSPGES